VKNLNPKSSFCVWGTERCALWGSPNNSPRPTYSQQIYLTAENRSLPTPTKSQIKQNQPGELFSPINKPTKVKPGGQHKTNSEIAAGREWNDTPKRLLGQKPYFWGNIDF
jgi:hypothetical protein